MVLRIISLLVGGLGTAFFLVCSFVGIVNHFGPAYSIACSAMALSLANAVASCWRTYE